MWHGDAHYTSPKSEKGSCGDLDCSPLMISTGKCRHWSSSSPHLIAATVLVNVWLLNSPADSSHTENHSAWNAGLLSIWLRGLTVGIWRKWTTCFHKQKTETLRKSVLVAVVIEPSISVHCRVRYRDLMTVCGHTALLYRALSLTQLHAVLLPCTIHHLLLGILKP